MTVQHDWETIAQKDPFFGVITDEQYRNANLDEDKIETFYRIGRGEIKRVHGKLAALFGDLNLERGLDVGCGVGRLAMPMRSYCDHVWGYDIAASMVSVARDQAQKQNIDQIEFTNQIPDGPFDWINSSIVFQHINPEEGLRLLETVLAKSANKCVLSLHFTLWQDEAPVVKQRHAWLGKRIAWVQGLFSPKEEDQPSEAYIDMYDYNLSEIYCLLQKHGFSEFFISHVQHGPRHGGRIFAQRSN